MRTVARPLRYLLALLLAAAASDAALSQQAAALAPDAGGVILHVTVTTTGGHGFASGVKRSSFALFDEKAQREITLFEEGAVPASVGIVLDTSETFRITGPPRGDLAPEAISKALSEFSALRGQGNDYFVFAFGERPQLLLDWTRDLASVQSAVASVRPKGSNIALYDACLAALDKLAQGAHRKRLLLVISGGADNKSQHKFDELRRRLKESDALFYGVGIRYRTSDVQWGSELAQAAAVTGGRSQFPFDAETIRGTFAELALELQRQYLIGFEPAGADGRYHRLEVKLRPVGNTEKELKGLQVRGREGYVAAGK